MIDVCLQACQTYLSTHNSSIHTQQKQWPKRGQFLKLQSTQSLKQCSQSLLILQKNQRMNRLFGAGKKEEVIPPNPPKKEEPQLANPPPKKATLPLTEQQARLENRVRQLSETVTRLDNQAKELLQKSKKSKGSAKEMYKQRCVNVLRKRKQYDIQLKNYMNQQFTLDQVGFTSESIQNTLEMGTTMKDVVQQQRAIMKDLDIDQLDDLRDQMDELKYESDYMNQMLNRDYCMDIDEDDLDDQLGELEKELKAEKNKEKKKEINPPEQLKNI